jgi:DHA1 family bicyclomycin/chloramphenicol resistance-like MFS transporter
MGAAGSSVLVLAIVRDVTDGRSLFTLLSRVTLVTTTAPLLAPVAGAALLPLVGWRGIFGVLAVISAAVLIAAALLVPETRVRTSQPKPLRHRLHAVWSDPAFRRGTVVGSMTYAGVYAYVAASPLLLQQVYGLNPRAYALAFLLNSLGLVLGVQLSARLVARVSGARVLGAFAIGTVMAASLILPLQWAGAGLVGLALCLWFFVTCCGGCFSAAAGTALGGQGDQSGTAASVYGFATFAAAGLLSPVAGLVGIPDATPVAVVLLATSSTALAGVALILRSERTGGNRTQQVAVTI